MKRSRYILGALAALALMAAIPVQAEMAAMEDSDLAGIAAKGDATINFGSYGWGDTHAADASDHKGALDNGPAASATLTGINTANVWGAYAGAEAFGPVAAGGANVSSATANGAIGGF
jgi:hypothetical protein